MTTEDIILHIFYLVATSLPAIPRHSQAKLYPSELITIGILFALKGGYFRAFYRWLQRDYGDWFGDGTLPERTRVQRLLKTHQDWCDLLLSDPTFFTVIDSYPIELLFPIREGRSRQQIGKKGRVKGMERVINAEVVTYDFARLMDGATEVKCSEFGDAIIKHM